MQYIDGTNASIYSTFTQSSDLTPDQMIMFQDVSATEMTNMARLQTLQAKTYLTDAERTEMTGLLVSLREFMPTSEDWNKLCAGLYSVEVFMRDGIVMFIKQKQDEFNAMLDDYTYIGEYNPVTQYKKGNMVTLSGLGFTCRQDCKGVSPDINGTTAYWTIYTIKGDKGDPSLNISYRGEYNASTTYNLSTGDAVSVDGTLYYAKVNGVVGLYPPYYTNSWTSLSNDAIYISTVLPTIGNRKKDTLYFLQTDTNNLEAGILQDYLGNVIKPKTDASNVVYNGNSVKNALDNLSSNNISYVITTNSGNNYSVTVPNITTLTDGLQIRVKFNVASTGTITVNMNGLGAKNVVDYFGNQVANVRVNLIANLCYESTSGNFILQGKGGDGTAIASQLIKGATATTKNGQIVGTLDLSNLVSANLKSGVTINGVIGKSSVVETSDATVVASKMLSGESGYVNGNKIIGNIPSKSSETFIPKTYNQTINSGQYLSGVQNIAGDANLISSNIVNTANIFGVQGTVPRGYSASGSFNYTIPGWHTFSGGYDSYGYNIQLGFLPDVIVFNLNGSTYIWSSVGLNTQPNNHQTIQFWGSPYLQIYFGNDTAYAWTVSGTWYAYKST
jgi:hypothetical protein